MNDPQLTESSSTDPKTQKLAFSEADIALYRRTEVINERARELCRELCETMPEWMAVKLTSAIQNLIRAYDERPSP